MAAPLCRALGWAARAVGGDPAPADVSWILLAALPNSGTTALARLLEASPSVGLLEGRGEGQWLLPALSRPVMRWDPDLDVDYSEVRRVWSDAARMTGAPVIFEKSPANLVRIEALADALGGPARVGVVVFSRDPMAVCASWAKRYTPERLAAEWLGGDAEELPRGPGLLRLLGGICGERMSALARATRTARVELRYEDLTSDTGAALSRLGAAFPSLELPAPDTSVGVKDYATQRLRDMNAEQVASLSGEERAAIADGLAAHGDAVRRFGYDPDRWLRE